MINEDICPLCHKPNNCEHHQAGPYKDSCWCDNLHIPRSVFDKVPPELLFKACICKKCLLKNGAKEFHFEL